MNTRETRFVKNVPVDDSQKMTICLADYKLSLDNNVLHRISQARDNAEATGHAIDNIITYLCDMGVLDETADHKQLLDWISVLRDVAADYDFFHHLGIAQGEEVQGIQEGGVL